MEFCVDQKVALEEWKAGDNDGFSLAKNRSLFPSSIADDGFINSLLTWNYSCSRLRKLNSVVVAVLQATTASRPFNVLSAASLPDMPNRRVSNLYCFGLQMREFLFRSYALARMNAVNPTHLFIAKAHCISAIWK